MLYLEDFLEMIEQLPSELRDRSTEMRMLDLQVQRGIDQNNKVIADFFQQAPSLSQEQRDQWYMKIKEDFQKIRDQAEEKVSIADAMYSLVEKYHNRLTREVMHFKYELEADSPGITETIERKLQDAERANIATRRERKRKAKILEALQEARASAEMGQRASTSSSSSWNGQPAHNDPTLPPPPLKLPNIKRAQTFPKQLVDSRSASTASSANLAQKAAMGANGSSFDPLKASQVSPLALPSGASMPAFTGSESRHGRPRKLTSRVQEMLKDTMHRHERTSRPPTFSTGDSDEEEGSDDGDELEHEDAKRTWCICNQKSFGDMVACDSKDCPFEWFHYHCVGIKEPPKGKWFCPHCTEAKLRKNIPVV